MVQSRRSIHSKTPLREMSDQEDELNFDDSQDPMANKSGSDVELEEKITHPNKDFTQERLEKSQSVPRTPRRQKINPENAFLTPKSTLDSNKLSFLCIFSVIGLLLIAIGFFVQPNKNCSFENVKKEYPKENPFLWKHLKIGIELILNAQTKKSAVYLFAHHGGEQVFQLIKDIAAHSSGCFGKQVIAAQMESDDFISPDNDDYGHVIEKYKNKIKKGNVILIANLNEIPPQAARALHTICDTHTPIAKNVVIFLTLTIQHNKTGSANAIVEETLIELWGSNLEPNVLDPLITRVTDEVIILQS